MHTQTKLCFKKDLKPNSDVVYKMLCVNDFCHDRHDRNGRKAANKAAANIFRCLFAKHICFQCAFSQRQRLFQDDFVSKAFFVAKCRVYTTSYVEDLFQTVDNQATWDFEESCCDTIQRQSGCTTSRIPVSFLLHPLVGNAITRLITLRILLT